MYAVGKDYDKNYCVWIEQDEYYKNDIWDIRKHKFYNNLTGKQKDSIEGRGIIDFSLCINENLRNELKNACAYMLEAKITKVHMIYHDKFTINYVMKYMTV